MKFASSKMRSLIATSTFAILALSQPAIAALPPPSGEASGGAVGQLLMQAQKAIKDGNVPLAVISLKNASSAAPRNGTIRAYLGSVLLQSGDSYSAERELRQARKDGAPDQIVLRPLFQAMLLRHEEKALLEEFPDSAAETNPAAAADIYKAHALAYQNFGQLPDAAMAMDKSLKFRRDEPGLLTRARISQAQHDIPAAMALTDEAVKLDPTAFSPMLFKFGLLMASKDYNAAQKVSDELIAKFPTNTAARFSRVDLLMQQGKNDQAIAAVNAVLAKTPGLAIGIYYRSLLQARSGDIKNAWRNAQTLPDSFVQAQPGAALAISQMAVGAGATDTAAAILANTVAKYPGDTTLRTRLAAIRLRQDNTEGALSALEPIKDKLDPAGSEILARLYLKVGRVNEALSILQKLNQTGKGTNAVTLSIVGIENQQGQSEEALKELTQAVAQKPNDPVLVSQLVTTLTRAGRYSEALATADKLGNDPAQRVPALAMHAQVLLAQKNLDGALATYNKAIQLAPSDPISLFGRANVFQMMERYPEAIADLNKILVANPKSVPTYLKLAEIAANQNQDQVVRSTLMKASAAVPSNTGPSLALIRYLLARNDSKGALGVANDLAKRQPKDLEAVAILGQAQAAAGQKSEAVATYRRLVAIAPKSPAPQMLLANALQANGDRAGASAAMKAAVAFNPNAADLRIAQINLQFAQGDSAGAVATAQAYRTANPSNTADIVLGDTFNKAGHADQAMNVFQQSFAARPNNTTLMRIAVMSIAAGKTDAALDLMSKWLDKNAGDVPVRLEYATLLMRKGDKVKSAAQYEQVLQRDPNNLIALNNLGWLKQTDDPQRAMALVTQAAKLAPKAANILDTLGWLKLQQKQAPASLAILKRAHDLSPKDGTIAYHLVMALDATGSHDAARGLLKALLASSAKFDDREAAAQLQAKWH